MINNDVLEKLGIKLNPCRLCEKPAEIDIISNGSKTGAFDDYYHILIKCSCCHNYMEKTIPAGWDDDEEEIRRVIQKWNDGKIQIDSLSTIDEKLKGFDDDQKSFVCILLYLAGYKFSPEDLSKYIQHSSINIRETFADMTLEQKSKAFVMIGQTLGYLPEGGNKNGWN